MNAHRTSLLLGAAAAIASLGLATASAWTGITGSGQTLTQQREVSGFTGVALSVPGRLEIVQGAAEGVTLTAVSHDVPRERFRSPAGDDLSDHPPVVVELTWETDG